MFENKKKIAIILIGLLFLILLYFFFRFWYGKGHELERKEERNLVTNLGDVNLDTVSCDNKYENLLSVNAFNFEEYCFKNNIDENKYFGGGILKKRINLVMIFDASGSMKAKVGGLKKIDIAKKAAKSFIQEIGNDNDMLISLIVYGHKGSNNEKDKSYSCNGVDEVYRLGKPDSRIINNKIDSLQANGWTPIDRALKKAKKILSMKSDDENFILLISDGKEKCDGNPVETIKEITEEGKIKVVVDVIGFDVGGSEERQLELIAEAGRGQYLGAKNALGLKKAFEERKKKLDELNYEKNKVISQVYDMSFSVNNYNQCRVALEQERAVMKIDINTNEFAGRECVGHANGRYNDRYLDIRNKIEKIFLDNKEKLDKLK